MALVETYHTEMYRIHISAKKMNYDDAVIYCRNLIRRGLTYVNGYQQWVRSKIAAPRNAEQLRKMKKALEEVQHRAATTDNGVTYVVRAWLGIKESNGKWILDDTKDNREATYMPICYDSGRNRRAVFSWGID